MKKYYLNVSYQEKDQAKSVGAKWDAVAKKWYIMDENDFYSIAEEYPEWIPEKEIQLIAPIYLGISTLIICWKCQQQTKVFTLGAHKIQVAHPSQVVCPVDLETYIADAEECCKDGLILVEYVSGLDEVTANFMKEYAPSYRLDYSKTVNKTYYMNHCDKCGIKIGDHTVHNEVGEGFGLVTYEESKLIQFLKTPLSIVKVQNCNFNEYWQSQDQFHSNGVLMKFK